MQHTSKIFEIFELYTYNMHRIPVRPPPSSALGRRRAAAIVGGEVGWLPCLGPMLLLALSASSGGAGSGAGVATGAAGRHMEQEKEQRREQRQERRGTRAEEEQEQRGGAAKQDQEPGVCVVWRWETPRRMQPMQMGKISLFLFFE